MRIIFIFLIALVSGCVESHPKSEVISLNQPMLLLETDRVRLEKAANGGDRSAAFRLFMYYDFGSFNHTVALKWLRKSAEQGYVMAQFDLGYLLVQEDDPDKKREGKEWLRKAARGGCARATDVLREIESKENKWTYRPTIAGEKPRAKRDQSRRYFRKIVVWNEPTGQP